MSRRPWRSTWAGRAETPSAPTSGCGPTQRPDGSWHTYYLANGQIEEPRLDTNVCAYVATGVWHHFLVTGDDGFLEDVWPVIERAIDFVVAWQRPGGELVWSVDPDGTPGRYGLLTGSSSAYFSLRCAIACAGELGHERPDWELAAGRLRHAIAYGTEGFASKDEFAMDWYYPVLAGALDPVTASDRIDERWSEFVIEQPGRAVCVGSPVGDRRRDRRVRHGPALDSGDVRTRRPCSAGCSSTVARTGRTRRASCTPSSRRSRRRSGRATPRRRSCLPPTRSAA